MEFAEKKNKSKVCCCVPGCHNISRRDPTIRFYHFPREKVSFVKIINKFNEEKMIDRRTAWIRALRMGKKVTPSMRVCSHHFIEDDFILPQNGKRDNRVKTYLKKTSIPSLNLPHPSTSKTLNSEEKSHDGAREESRRRSPKSSGLLLVMMRKCPNQ